MLSYIYILIYIYFLARSDECGCALYCKCVFILSFFFLHTSICNAASFRTTNFLRGLQNFEISRIPLQWHSVGSKLHI